MIPANAGPQAARKASGASKKLPLYTAIKENPSPQVMAKVKMKKAVVW
jgi:hypothetical protein